MYVVKSSAVTPSELEQGDLVSGVLKMEPATSAQVAIRTGANVTAANDPQIEGDLSKLRIVLSVRERPNMMVISNSCDNERGTNQLLFVPVRPLTLTGSHEDQWREINQRATGGGYPKSFYLAAAPQFGLLARMEARFDEMFPATPSYFERFKNAKRLCGLNVDAVNHLRWAIGNFFGRNSRNDFEWQTDADLELRSKSLADAVARDARPELRDELKAVIAELERRGLVEKSA